MGGAGLFERGHGPIPPNRAGMCDGCQYWPVYPCHSSSMSSTVQVRRSHAHSAAANAAAL
eukprot:6481403-Prymnesium_polylepis.1